MERLVHAVPPKLEYPIPLSDDERRVDRQIIEASKRAIKSSKTLLDGCQMQE
jgi:hypothetical protein